MMVIPDREELKKLSEEELNNRRIAIVEYISNYENNKIPQEEYYVKPSPQTKYKLYKEYLKEIQLEMLDRKYKTELGHGIDMDENKDLENVVDDENNFKFLNKKIEELTKELAEAYRNNNQSLINKLQIEIQEETDKQLHKNVDTLVQEDTNNNAVIRKYYIDENGYEREREKIIEAPLPVFPIIDLSIIAENIYNEIEKLSEETEFTMQQFLKDYNVEDKDKFSICNSVFDLCKSNNIVVVEKMQGADLGLPWNVIRIKKGNKTDKKLVNIIDNKLKEFDDNTANNLRNYILDIINKIIDLPNDYETTISEIINYMPENNFVDPLTQGIIYNKVNEICKEIKINLQSTYDKFGGLAFYYTFVKMKENEVFTKQPESDTIEDTNINKEIVKSEISYICYYDFIPYKQIGPIRLNVSNDENYEETGAPHLNNNGINHALCKALFIDSPEIVKRDKNRKDEVYIMCNGIKIKITSDYNTFIEELKKICDDIKTIEIPDKSYTLTVSEQLGIIITAENINGNFLIRYISFCGKDVFYEKIRLHKEENN